MRMRNFLFLLIIFTLVMSGCTPSPTSTLPVATSTYTMVPTMTQTVPMEIYPTYTPDPVLFSMLLPSNADNFGPEFLSSDSKWVVLEYTHLLVSGKDGEFANILISQRESGKWTEILTEDEMIDPLYLFAFSPDNHYLAALGREGIWIINLQDINEKTYYYVKRLGRTPFALTWTPDSKSVLFAIEDEKYILAQLDLEGNIKPILTISDVFPGQTKLEVNDGLYFVRVTFSPDGKEMAYVTGAPGSKGCFEVWKYNFETGKKELIVDDEYDISIVPLWSPDGSKIAFVSYQEIDLLDLNTKSAIKIYKKNDTLSTDNIFWSPDGKSIVFDDYFDSDFHIILYDIENKELRTVLVGNYNLTSWGTTNNSIFVEYHPLHSNERYLQEVRIE